MSIVSKLLQVCLFVVYFYLLLQNKPKFAFASGSVSTQLPIFQKLLYFWCLKCKLYNL